MIRTFSHQAAAVLLVLAGCAVGPNYHRPKVNTPANWSEAQLGGATNSLVQVVEWWKTFNDPTLNSLIERAVIANWDLKAAEGRLLEARAMRSGAIFDLGPTIDSSIGFQDRKISKNAQTFTIPRKHTENFDAHFDATWEIDIFGGRRRALQAATAAFVSIEEDRRAVLISVLSEVARNYIQMRGFQQRLVIAQKNILAQNEAVDIARARFKAGLRSELDVKQSEALLATTRAQIPSLETSMKQGIHQLSVLLGQPPGALAGELLSANPIPNVPPVVPIGLPSELLRRRPDVRRAERELASATALIGVSTAELFPKLTLLGIGGLQSLSLSDWFTAGSRYTTAGPTVTWRILDYGHVRAEIKAAGARADQSLAAYEKTVLTSFREVEDALVAYSNEQVRYKLLTEAAAADRRATELANELYQKGLGDFLNVLDAQRSLYQAEDQMMDSSRAVSEDLVILYKALGGGWETGDEKAQARK